MTGFIGGERKERKVGASWLQWGNLRERGRCGGVLPHLGACRVEQPSIFVWGVCDPLFSLSAATMSCWAPGQRWVPCTDRAWLWCRWPDGGPGVQTRKPLHASWSEDMGSVNIYYLPKGNKAWLGPPPPEGAQMGAVGATLQAASCSLLGGFRPDVSSGRGPFPSSGSHSGLCLIGRW